MKLNETIYSKVATIWNSHTIKRLREERENKERDLTRKIAEIIETSALTIRFLYQWSDEFNLETTILEYMTIYSLRIQHKLKEIIHIDFNLFLWYRKNLYSHYVVM